MFHLNISREGVENFCACPLTHNVDSDLVHRSLVDEAEYEIRSSKNS